MRKALGVAAMSTVPPTPYNPLPHAGGSLLVASDAFNWKICGVRSSGVRRREAGRCARQPLAFPDDDDDDEAGQQAFHQPGQNLALKICVAAP